MEETVIDTIEWSAPEYTHKERTMDWYWTIGLIALVGAIVAIWFHSYVFGIFILISGACLILFTMREPQIMNFSIKTEGLEIGKDKHTWKEIKGFHIKQSTPYSKLLVMTSKKFLPIYTIPFPPEISSHLREEIEKVTPNIELQESNSMLFAEKIGF